MKRGEAVDARLFHAVGLVSLSCCDSPRRAAEWYERAANVAPTHYSWPSKGLVVSLLAQGDFDHALVACQDFAARANKLVGHNREPWPQHFIQDTACFSGRVVAWVVDNSHNSDPYSVEAAVAAKLPGDVRKLFAETVSTGQAYLQNGQQTGVGSAYVFLGDTRVEEREALLESLGDRACKKGGYRVQYVKQYQRPSSDTADFLRPIPRFQLAGGVRPAINGREC